MAEHRLEDDFILPDVATPQDLDGHVGDLVAEALEHGCSRQEIVDAFHRATVRLLSDLSEDA